MTTPFGSLSPDSSMISVAARLALEQAVARIIQLDPVVARNLAELEGKMLLVRSTAPVMDIFVRFGECPEFLTVCEQPADCTLTGASISLLRLALAEEPLAHLQQADIALEGSSDLLITAARIFREAEFDWEGLLAQYTGGVVAHVLGSTVRQGRFTAGQAARVVLRNLPEYMQEELRVLPPSGEVEAFMEDLDQLRLATDRLQARVDRLVSQDQSGKAGGK